MKKGFTFEGAITEAVELLTDLVHTSDEEITNSQVQFREDAKNELEALVYAHKFILDGVDLEFNAKMFFKHVEKLSWESTLVKMCTNRIDMVLSDL